MYGIITKDGDNINLKNIKTVLLKRKQEITEQLANPEISFFRKGTN